MLNKCGVALVLVLLDIKEGGNKMTFYIKYAFVINGPRGIEYIGDKEIRVKNKPNELGAKVALEDYLKRKYGSNFIRLEVNSCEQDPMEQFYEMFGMGGNRNPFGGF